MTKRKPPGMDVGDWVEQQLQEAQRRGDFEDLAGEGKPIPKLADPHDPDWWVKDFLRREQIEADALLPPTVLLRKEKARIAETVAKMRTEDEVRDYLEDLNKRILVQVRDATGPVIPVGKMDEEAVIEQWRQEHPAPAPSAKPEQQGPKPKRSFWQRLFS
jgi:hypothetical protein